MKKILLVGGNGQIGKILNQELRQSNAYEVVVGDINILNASDLYLDATDFEQLQTTIPDDIDCLILLIAAKLENNILNETLFDNFISTYLKTTYHLLLTALNKNIPKVILTSSNHTTDFYEENGYSTLNREITIHDYPYSQTLYGMMKTASENLSHIFSTQYGLSVINLRIGTYRENAADILESDRSKRTWISAKDIVDLYTKAIETPRKFGTYYGVSENPSKPWSIEQAKSELGYHPTQNSLDVMKLVKK